MLKWFVIVVALLATGGAHAQSGCQPLVDLAAQARALKDSIVTALPDDLEKQLVDAGPQLASDAAWRAQISGLSSDLQLKDAIFAMLDAIGPVQNMADRAQILLDRGCK